MARRLPQTGVQRSPGARHPSQARLHRRQGREPARASAQREGEDNATDAQGTLLSEPSIVRLRGRTPVNTGTADAGDMAGWAPRRQTTAYGPPCLRAFARGAALPQPVPDAWPADRQADGPAAPATFATYGSHHRRPRAPCRTGAGHRRDTPSPPRPPRRARPAAPDGQLLRACPRHVICCTGGPHTVGEEERMQTCTRVFVPVPPMLEAALGYPGTARYVAF